MDVGSFGFTIAGLIVGFIVGMTGVGGGSLMTPILLWFGISPATAVGTDLLYAAITKASGVWVHARNKNVDWKITGLLSLGSVPAAALTLWFLSTLNTDTSALNAVIKQGLAVVLILTALAILFKSRLQAFASRHAGDHYHLSDRSLNTLTVLTGVVLGVMVTLTSIGAGALGTVALFLLYPFTVTRRLVGTEIAHAVPLTTVAGWAMRAWATWTGRCWATCCWAHCQASTGSHLTGRISDRVLRPCLAAMLLLIGYKLAF